MSLADALKSVFFWLCTTGATFSPLTAREVSSTRFELSVEQLEPEHRRRAFVVLAEAVPHCWRVEEIA